VTGPLGNGGARCGIQIRQDDTGEFDWIVATRTVLVRQHHRTSGGKQFA
jgi:hypothetical protein